MSLINDALKRAKQSQSPNPPGGAPPLLPVDAAPQPAGRPRWMMVSALLLFIAAACFFAGPLACDHKTSSPPAATNAPAPQVASPPAPPAPAVPAKPAEAAPKVQGIIYDSKNPLAVVNGKSVQIGDRVGTFRVKMITSNAVTFQRADGSVAVVTFDK